MIRPQNTLLVVRADAKVGTRPTLADAASGRAGASVPRINPATKGRVNSRSLKERGGAARGSRQDDGASVSDTVIRFTKSRQLTIAIR